MLGIMCRLPYNLVYYFKQYKLFGENIVMKKSALLIIVLLFLMILTGCCKKGLHLAGDDNYYYSDWCKCDEYRTRDGYYDCYKDNEYFYSNYPLTSNQVYEYRRQEELLQQQQQAREQQWQHQELINNMNKPIHCTTLYGVTTCY